MISALLEHVLPIFYVAAFGLAILTKMLFGK